MSNPSEDDFLAYAKKFEADEAARKANRGTGGGNYEELNWTGLDPNKMKIVRFLGGIPDTPTADKYSAHIVQIGRIKGDDGKEFRSVLPSKEKAPDHLMWRILARVNEVTYINRKRVFVNESNKNKDIYDLVNYNGIPEGDPKRKFQRGWEGRNVIVANVIDRERMDWHRENKHTLLLSRSVTEGDAGRIYADEGVPVYGFFNVIINTLFKHYGNWETYDIGAVRTGTTETPYRLYNASKYAASELPEVPSELWPIISQAKGLTAEEASWARYDLDKVFAPTSYTKYYNKLRVAIQTIDARLGTKFFGELEYEMEKEKAAREAAKANGETTEGEETPAASTYAGASLPAASEPAPAAAPTRTRTLTPAAAPSNVLSPEKIAALQGWDQLSAEMRASIVDVKVRDGVAVDITYNTADGLVGCPSCRVAAPEAFDVCCPACGQAF